MTHCYNCGHTGTFVLLAQFALAVPGPDAHAADAADTDRDATASSDRKPSDVSGDRNAPGDCGAARADSEDVPESGGLSLSVQCPACDSTDVGVSADDLLARYGATTTS